METGSEFFTFVSTAPGRAGEVLKLVRVQVSGCWLGPRQQLIGTYSYDEAPCVSLSFPFVMGGRGSSHVADLELPTYLRITLNFF